VHSIEGEAPKSLEAMEMAFRDVDAFNARLQSGDQWVFAGGFTRHKLPRSSEFRRTR
jgi:hypothetical protein